MATIKDQLKGGISAMFGETSEAVSEGISISEEEYLNLETQQMERRKFVTGRKPNDGSNVSQTQNDMRTSIIVDKNQYAVVREIALRECMTIKEIIYAMFELGINRYELKHGKVHVRKPARSNQGSSNTKRWQVVIDYATSSTIFYHDSSSEVYTKLLDAFQLLLYRKIVDLTCNGLVIYRKTSFLLKIKIPPGTRGFKNASFYIPQVILEELDGTFFIQQGIRIVRIINLPSINKAKILQIILYAFRLN